MGSMGMNIDASKMADLYRLANDPVNADKTIGFKFANVRTGSLGGRTVRQLATDVRVGDGIRQALVRSFADSGMDRATFNKLKTYLLGKNGGRAEYPVKGLELRKILTIAKATSRNGLFSQIGEDGGRVHHDMFPRANTEDLGTYTGPKLPSVPKNEVRGKFYAPNLGPSDLPKINHDGQGSRQSAPDVANPFAGGMTGYDRYSATGFNPYGGASFARPSPQPRMAAPQQPQPRMAAPQQPQPQPRMAAPQQQPKTVAPRQAQPRTVTPQQMQSKATVAAPKTSAPKSVAEARQKAAQMARHNAMDKMLFTTSAKLFNLNKSERHAVALYLKRNPSFADGFMANSAAHPQIQKELVGLALGQARANPTEKNPSIFKYFGSPKAAPAKAAPQPKVASKAAPKADSKLDGWETFSDQEIKEARNQRTEELKQQAEALKQQTEAIRQEYDRGMAPLREQQARMNQALRRFS